MQSLSQTNINFGNVHRVTGWSAQEATEYLTKRKGVRAVADDYLPIVYTGKDKDQYEQLRRTQLLSSDLGINGDIVGGTMRLGLDDDSVGKLDGLIHRLNQLVGTEINAFRDALEGQMNDLRVKAKELPRR